MAKKKKGDRRKDSGEEEEYEFEMPEFDEQRFMRREVDSARITFVTVAIAFLVGLAAFAFDQLGGNYRFGWLAIGLGMFGLGPLLRRLGYTGELTEGKAILGSLFLLFFTALAVWVLAYNVPV